MTGTEMARALGSRGGRQRAQRLTASERCRIAALGGEARRRSLQLARRIAENFAYVAAIDELRASPPVSVDNRVKRLPGVYPGD